jgi:hypothetical protein
LTLRRSILSLASSNFTKPVWVYGFRGTGHSSSGFRRYEKASTIITSNKGFVDWGEIFNDQVLATAILDRLLHHCTTLNIKGESYRLKEKRKAGIFGLPPKAQELKSDEEAEDESSELWW